MEGGGQFEKGAGHLQCVGLCNIGDLSALIDLIAIQFRNRSDLVMHINAGKVQP